MQKKRFKDYQAKKKKKTKKNDTPPLSIFVSVRLVSFVAATVSNLRITCIAVSNLGIWGPHYRSPSPALSHYFYMCTIFVRILIFSEKPPLWVKIQSIL